MKKLFITLVAPILIYGCNDTKNAKFKEGDIVYLKPDCKKGVVWHVNTCGYMYSISFSPDDWTCIKVEESQIFGTECPK